MSRLIDPPREDHGKLPTPFTGGEQRIVDLFDAALPVEWEIYIQPHLNGLRPDIVLLHPNVGVAVFEIKDWDLEAMQYFAKSSGDSHPTLMARDKNGQVFSVESDNPINKIRLYEEEIQDLYCPRLDIRAGAAVITAGLIFPRASRSEIERVFGPFRSAGGGMSRYPQYYPLAGREDVTSGNLRMIFPESKRHSSQIMTAELADDLRGWLREPYYSKEQRTAVKLDARQRELATTRTESGYRRIKGPAGSGKSAVLASRAAALASQGKHVLVVSFNITLLNYLRDLTVRYEASRRVIRLQIDFLNFHSWCKRVCLSTGHSSEYRAVWRRHSDADEVHQEVALNKGLPALVQRLYQRDAGNDVMPRYDAILVDEGQDFLPDWWQTLRPALKAGGEMVLVADKTQNIYDTASAWTEDVMANAGFRGPWADLKTSYRLPPAIVPFVCRFAELFLIPEEIDTPQVENTDDQFTFSGFFPVELRWHQVRDQSIASEICYQELCRMMQRLHRDTAIPDIVFLSDIQIGRTVAALLEKVNAHVLHTFDADEKVARRQKRAFFKGSAQIKATTLHSFKGWEARHLVLHVGRVARPEDRALIYTALTRLQRHEHGSSLTVVSSCDELISYGQGWPEFVQS